MYYVIKIKKTKGEYKMAWNIINYTCGHNDRIQMYGKNTERESRKAWLEKGVCPDCYRKQKEEERKIESEVAAEQARENGLPELAGSEKQIAWAETIRKNALTSTRNKIKEGYVAKDAEEAALIKVSQEAKNQLETEKSAKWWIDNRSNVNTYVYDCVKNAYGK
jgi:hypothetical protein